MPMTWEPQLVTITPEWLNAQCGLLDLTREQMEAVRRAAQVASVSPQARQLLQRDAEILFSAQPAHLAAAEAELRVLYGEAWRMHAVLTLLTRLPWLVRAYGQKKIPLEILRDTLSDVRIWMADCRRKTGSDGLSEYEWLSHHFRMELFRIGRLQYQPIQTELPAQCYRHVHSGQRVMLALEGNVFRTDGEADGSNGVYDERAWTAHLHEAHGQIEGTQIHMRGVVEREPVKISAREWKCVLKPGDSVLALHIAAGESLLPAAVDASLARAKQFFQTYFPTMRIAALTCNSWLMDWALSEIAPHSNIAQFQQRFYCVPEAKASDEQMFQRVFGVDPPQPGQELSAHTALQQAILAWYAQGKKCRGAQGVLWWD